MSVWQAYVDLMLGRILSDEHYSDATPEEVVDVLVGSAPRHIQFPTYERGQLVLEVEQRRGRAPSSTTTWTPEQANRWLRITRAWRTAGRPRTASATADALDVADSTLRVWLHGLGLRWHDALDRLEAERED